MNNQNNKKGMKLPGVGLYLIIALVVMGTIGVLLDFPAQQDTVTYSDIVAYFKNEQVDAFVIDGTELTIQLKDEQIIKYDLPGVDIFYYDLGDLITEQRDAGIIRMQDFKVSDTSWFSVLLP